MICDNCPNSGYNKTSVPSCFLPHCVKLYNELKMRHIELHNKNKHSLTNDELAEYDMLKSELKERHSSNK